MVVQKKVMDFEWGGDGVLRYQGSLCVPTMDELQETIMEKAHRSRYSINAYLHKDASWLERSLLVKYYYESITEFVAKCMKCQQLKIEH